MTKTDLIAQVAANTEMSKKSAEMAVNAAFEALGKAMAEGEKISISGFGTFDATIKLLFAYKHNNISRSILEYYAYTPFSLPYVPIFLPP